MPLLAQTSPAHAVASIEFFGNLTLETLKMLHNEALKSGKEQLAARLEGIIHLKQHG